jgi:putative transposase
VQRTWMRLLAYVVMRNHWHLVLWPQRDGELERFMTWLTLTHSQRWHATRGSAGHLNQGRYNSALVQADDHLLAVCCVRGSSQVAAGLCQHAIGCTM